MGDLRADLRAVHNDIDQLNHALDTSRKQQRDLYADLDQRLKALEARSGVVASAGSGRGRRGRCKRWRAPMQAGRLRRRPGGRRLRHGGLPGGVRSSQGQPVRPGDRRFPAVSQRLIRTAQLADNAQYWLGEAYYVNKSFPEALAAFQGVVSKYPQSRKVPDALVKVGYCDYELKQCQAAHDTLAQVVANISGHACGPFGAGTPRQDGVGEALSVDAAETRAPAHQ